MGKIHKTYPYLTAFIFIPWIALLASDKLTFQNEIELAAPVLFLIIFALIPLFFWKLEQNFRFIIMPVLFVSVISLLYLYQKQYLFSVGFEYFRFASILPVYYIIGESIFFDLIFVGTPATNTFYLAAGSVMANFIGGPAASILMIKPFIRANRYRKYSAHTIVFYIIIIANSAAFISPLANTHLYMAYLKGFSPENFIKLFPVWLITVGILLFIFYLVDGFFFLKEPAPEHPAKKLAIALKSSLHNIQLKQSLIMKTIQFLERPTLQIHGAYNFWLLPVIFIILIFTSQIKSQIPYRELALIVLAIYSFIVTPVVHYKKAVIVRLLDLLFLYFLAFFIVGFIAKMFIEEYPIYLDTVYKAWMMSLISGIVDNVSTSIIIFNPEFLSRSILDHSSFLTELIYSDKKFKNITSLLVGISIMGALTYTGNYVNIFIRDEAEKYGIKMPNFFVYILYSFPALLIVSIVVLFYLLKTE